jgi:hypothetical protein
MKIINQAVLPDIDTKVLFIETAKHHFHVVAMATNQRFYSISGKNVRWVAGSFADTSRHYQLRCYAAESLYLETVKEYRKDARARAKKAKLLSIAA